MSTNRFAGVLHVASIAGSSQKPYFLDGEIVISEDQEDGAALVNVGGNMQGVKSRGRITTVLASDLSTDIRISHRDTTEALIGSVDLLANGLVRLALRIQAVTQMKGGAGEQWAYPINTNRIFSGSLTCDVRSDESPALLIAIASGTYANLNLTLDFTIGGTNIEVPVRISSVSAPMQKDGLQRITVEFGDRSGRTGITVLPSGTTTLLQKFINAWQTAIAFEFQAASADSWNASGNMVFESADIVIEDGRLVPIPYTFQTQGEVTVAAVS